MVKAIVHVIVLACFWACNPQPVGDQKAIKKEIDSRKIRRLTRSEILESASETGEMIAAEAQKLLSKTLLQKIQNQGISDAIEHCNVVATPLMDSLARVYGATVKRVNTKVRNPKNRADDIETEILHAYQYAVDNDLQTEPNIQEIDQDIILFTKPIILSNPVCLNCHGNIGTDIDLKNHSVIKSLYPQDNATGYQVGDLRGMWSIRFLKKVIINQME